MGFEIPYSQLIEKKLNQCNDRTFEDVWKHFIE